MLLRNDVLLYKEGPISALRILWIHPGKPTAFVIDATHPLAVPEPRELRQLEDDLESGLAKLAIWMKQMVVHRFTENFLPK
ncbi:hypothetical protein [Silvimonas iriomotensis]|uniref:Uncharacterized protein n=1 Tax=Silvimonas iriomotensis TaxID=449662 RepID=A0ABQ2PBN4_9NEIS|nr:hypothetical protein [Silvimonas iriomotensis]GGP22617.1 hypothetical protein GCM10010970_26210 [Silvimonas iriomotensis]